MTDKKLEENSSKPYVEICLQLLFPHSKLQIQQNQQQQDHKTKGI